MYPINLWLMILLMMDEVRCFEERLIWYDEIERHGNDEIGTEKNMRE